MYLRQPNNSIPAHTTSSVVAGIEHPEPMAPRSGQATGNGSLEL